MDQTRYHAFISYAWADNQPFAADGRLGEQREAKPSGTPAGWVSTFVDRFEKHLRRGLPRDDGSEPIWLDYQQLRGSDTVQPTIHRELAASSLLLPIVSRSWFDSPWCRDEFETFVEQHPDAMQRLFPVWMEPVERAGLPPAAQAIWDRLDQLLKYRFWYKDAGKRVRTRWFPDNDPTDRENGDQQMNMARDACERLRTLAQGQASPATDPAPAPVHPAQPPQPIAGNHLVLVNGGCGDAARVQAVADRLSAHYGLGYIIPLMAQAQGTGLKPSDLNRDLRENLKLATAVLMVFCDGPVVQVHEQLRACMQAAAKRPPAQQPSLILCHDGRQPLTFRPPGMQVQTIDPSCADRGTTDCVAALVAGLKP